MLKKVYIKPNKSIIKHWINTLIPEYDVFFFKDITAEDYSLVHQILLSLKSILVTIFRGFFFWFNLGNTHIMQPCVCVCVCV